MSNELIRVSNGIEALQVLDLAPLSKMRAQLEARRAELATEDLIADFSRGACVNG